MAGGLERARSARRCSYSIDGNAARQPAALEFCAKVFERRRPRVAARRAKGVAELCFKLFGIGEFFGVQEPESIPLSESLEKAGGAIGSLRNGNPSFLQKVKDRGEAEPPFPEWIALLHQGSVVTRAFPALFVGPQSDIHNRWRVSQHPCTEWFDLEATRTEPHAPVGKASLVIADRSKSSPNNRQNRFPETLAERAPMFKHFWKFVSGWSAHVCIWNARVLFGETYGHAGTILAAGEGHYVAASFSIAFDHCGDLLSGEDISLCPT